MDDGSEGSQEEIELDFESEIEFNVKSTRYRVVVQTKECVIVSLCIFPCDSNVGILEARVDDNEPQGLRESKQTNHLFCQTA